ncbi:MAG: histidinol dehydrogenase [Spirochaetales bacterium]|nr:histidinol dehydrogenase [Spirochaetales bacterium]
MKIHYYTSANEALEKILNRTIKIDPAAAATVTAIVEDVKKKGDKALLKYTKKFSRVSLEPHELKVKSDYFRKCLDQVDRELLKIIKDAMYNIRKYHENQVQPSWIKEFADGVKLGQRITPLDRVGVYVPGGKAFYPSTLLMNIIPAQIAGVREIVVATPPELFYKTPLLGAVLALLDVKEVYLAGGAQGIAALAFGTETIPKVDKIVGPGNLYVSLAKREVFGYVDIDMIAGPSEVCVLADGHANPEWVALDLLSQAEHRTGYEAAILVTNSETLAEKVGEQIYYHLRFSGHKEIIEKILDEYGAIIVVDDLSQGIEVVNKIAPEHLEIYAKNHDTLLKQIRHAGAIFIGEYSSEPVGDYWAGPNHVLPTGGTARFFSPLGVYDFVKRSSLVYYTKAAILKNADKIAAFAESENLHFHGKAVTARVAEIRGMAEAEKRMRNG